MKKYHTEQRRRLLSFLQEHSDRQFSVEEIAEYLCGDGTISVSSIYRNINAMAAEGAGWREILTWYYTGVTIGDCPVWN